MSEHSPAEWRELIDKLTALEADKTETPERREKAREILRRIEQGPTRLVGRNRSRNTTYIKDMTDMEYDGTIV